MRHTRGFNVRISSYAYWTIKDARFGPFSDRHTYISLVVVCRLGHCLGWRLSPIDFFFLARVFVRLEMRHPRDFGVGISNYAYWAF